ncbi:hypothetical protein [Bacteroides sp.]
MMAPLILYLVVAFLWISYLDKKEHSRRKENRRKKKKTKGEQEQ